MKSVSVVPDPLSVVTVAIFVERLFEPLLKSPVDVILPQDRAPVVMEFVPLLNVPDEVTAPQVTLFVPLLNVPDEVTAPHVSW